MLATARSIWFLEIPLERLEKHMKLQKRKTHKGENRKVNCRTNEIDGLSLVPGGSRLKRRKK